MAKVEHFKYLQLGSLEEACDGVIDEVGCIGLLMHLGFLAASMFLQLHVLHQTCHGR